MSRSLDVNASLLSEASLQQQQLPSMQEADEEVSSTPPAAKALFQDDEGAEGDYAAAGDAAAGDAAAHQY